MAKPSKTYKCLFETSQKALMSIARPYRVFYPVQWVVNKRRVDWNTIISGDYIREGK